MKKQICKKTLRALAIVGLVVLTVMLFAACEKPEKSELKYFSASILDELERGFVGQDVPEDIADFRGECTYYENGEFKKIELYGISGFAGETAVLEFDESGKIIKGEHTYAFDGEEVKETIAPTYDENGNCVKVEYILPDNTAKGYMEYEYDENDNCISCKAYEYGNLVWHNVYEYDQNGNCTKIICYNEKNVKSSEIGFAFGENNNCIKQTNIIYTEDGAVLIWEDTELDENGNKIKNIRYNSDGSVKNWREYEYDENGNQIGCVTYDKQGNITKQEETDQNGNTISSSYKNGKLLYRAVKDKNHNLLESFDYNSDGEMISCSKYEYDENGNRIKEISYDADGKIKEHSEYSPANKKLIKRVDYDNDEKVRRVYAYEYNSDGERSKELLYNADNELQEYTIFGQGTDGRIDKTYNADDVLVSIKEWKTVEKTTYVALSTEFYPDGSIKNKFEQFRNPDRAIDTYYYKNGKIQSVIEYDEDWQVVKETNYDMNGNVVENSGESSSGNVSEPDPNMHLEYDANGNVVKITVTDDLGQIRNICYFGADGKETSQIVYSYYDSGNLYMTTEVIHGVGSTRIEYYENGNKKQEATLNASGAFLVVIFYDENGNVTSTIDRTGNR